jgi:hypothetical protein
VFNRTIAYRDRRVVGVFVRFRASLRNIFSIFGVGHDELRTADSGGGRQEITAIADARRSQSLRCCTPLGCDKENGT